MSDDVFRTSGVVILVLGLVLMVLADRLENAGAWLPAGSWLRFGKLWGTMGPILALIGVACVLVAD